jgi:hypothetical protein
LEGLDKFIKGGEKSDFKIKVSINEWIIGSRRQDITTKDKRAVRRNPTYLICAFITGSEPNEEQLKEIYRQLKTLPEIEEEGPSEDLFIGGEK